MDGGTEMSITKLSIDDLVADTETVKGNSTDAKAAITGSATAREERRHQRTVSSMLWSAWADALGFISELTDSRGLKRRIGHRELLDPVTWTRRVGGKFGVNAELPAGCYSDDTQLRLATARAISNHGFDVEAFARVELTVWPSYALGGGRSSRAAAAGMSKANASWCANFYRGWQEGGGNGVAMRIQPHVWASRDLSGSEHLLEVIVNGVVSHGHPRALVGAVLHASALAFALNNRTPLVSDWPELLRSTRNAIDRTDEQTELVGLWRPSWERATGADLKKAWHATVDECEALARSAGPIVSELSDVNGTEGRGGEQAYSKLVEALQLDMEAVRGSATSTVVAALALAAVFEGRPADAARMASHALRTDTDTIATMAAAVVAAGADVKDPSPVLDEEYLRSEAHRLAAIGLGHPVPSFAYPDLLHWHPPQSQLDCVGTAGGQVALAGLGWLKPIGDLLLNGDAAWRWMRTDFGASVLVKQRPTLRALPSSNLPMRANSDNQAQERDTQPSITGVQLEIDDTEPVTTSAPDRLGATESKVNRNEQRLESHRWNDSSGGPGEVDQMLEWVARRNYDARAIGYAVTRLSEVASMEQLISFTSAVRTVLRTRTPR